MSIQILSTDELFRTFKDWFDNQNLQGSTHLLEANYSQKQPFFKLTVGFGNHYVKIGKDRFWISRTRLEKTTDYGRTPEVITITAFGLNRSAINELLISVVKIKKTPRTKIYLWNEGKWSMALARPKRLPSSLHLPGHVWGSINTHLKNFEKNKDFHDQNGIPYKTGICFHGPPGTGKTSLVFALAGMIDRNVYLMSLNDISDRALASAIQELDENAILLIEDIDTYDMSQKRNPEEKKKVDNNLTLAGLLQALDGYLAPVGLIIIMTTNHPDALDPAIKREGRIDLMLEIGNWDQAFANEVALKLNVELKNNGPLNPAKFIHHQEHYVTSSIL